MLRPISVPHDMIADFQLSARERQFPGGISVVFAKRVPLVELAHEQVEWMGEVVGHWALRWAGALSLSLSHQ